MTREDHFEAFWRAYPRRIGKGAARNAFQKAIRKTDLETMLTAIEAYVQHKPSWQDFCHPSTWLNQERWSDEWETPTNPQNYADYARSLMNHGSESHPRHLGNDELLFPGPRRH